MPLCVMLETPIGQSTHVCLQPLPEHWRLPEALQRLTSTDLWAELLVNLYGIRDQHLGAYPPLAGSPVGKERWSLVYREKDGQLKPVMEIEATHG